MAGRGVTGSGRPSSLPVAQPPPVVQPPTAAGPRAGARAQAKARRAAEKRSRTPWFVRQFVFSAALAGVALGLILVMEQRWRQGLFGVGAVLLVMALARLVLPVRAVGMLAVRGRLFDVLTLLLLSGAVFGLTLAVPLPTP